MIRNIIDFPGFLWANFRGLVIAIVTDFLVFVVFVIGALLSAAIGPLLGIAAALLIWLLLRQVSSMLTALLGAISEHSQMINLLARVIRDNPYFAEKVLDRASQE